MTTSTDIASPKNTKEIAARIGWAALICATLYVCYFSHLGAIGFVGPDEPRYAWIARDMAETGDWVTPRLYGRPWFEKPPLYYWGAAICFKLFGVSEAAARMPSAISALLATLAMAWLAWRIYGGETARWVLLLLPTTVGMIGFSHAAATDMPFSAMLTIAMVCAAVALGLVPDRSRQDGAQHSLDSARDKAAPLPSDGAVARRRWLSLTLFGFFLGLAVLAKGPAGVILCGGAVFFWAVFAKRWRDTIRLFHPVAIAAFCVTALPWYILCACRNPDFVRVFIIEHNFKRYLTPEFQHIQPFWFYIPVLLVALLPWSLAIIWMTLAGLSQAWRTRVVSKAPAFFVSWTVFSVGFFSLSQSKLPGYVLPAIPPICALAARSLIARARAQAKSFRLTLLTAALLMALLFALVELVTPRFSHGNEGFGVAAGLTIAAVGSANFILAIAYAARGGAGLSGFAGASCVLPVLLLLSLSHKLLPSFLPFIPSGRTVARELQLHKVPASELFVAPINRSLHYGLNFYLEKEIKDWDDNHPADGYILTGVGWSCRRLAQPVAACEQIPFDIGAKTGRFLYRIKRIDSPAGAAGGGKAE